MKKDQYFNVEVNFMSDEHVAGMMMELDPGQSLGIYFMLLLHLRKKDDYTASCSPEALRVIAWQNRVDVDMVDRIVHDFGLFEVDEEQQTFRSPYLDRVMLNLEEKWRKNAENGKKGGRPAKMSKTSEKPMDKGRKPNETQESKVEEKRSITTVVNNSSNTGGEAAPAAVAAVERMGVVAAERADVAVARTADVVAAAENRVVPVTNVGEATPAVVVRSVDEEGQRPLQAVGHWAKLVDSLAGYTSYMELVGMHSGLGELFVNQQQRVLELFKIHIQLYDKAKELPFIEDVKRYFSNYVAAGSVTCDKLRETLLAEERERKSVGISPFETVVDGQRTYLGHPIPPQAPPRPSFSAVWDERRNRWGQ